MLNTRVCTYIHDTRVVRYFCTSTLNYEQNSRVLVLDTRLLNRCLVVARRSQADSRRRSHYSTDSEHRPSHSSSESITSLHQKAAAEGNSKHEMKADIIGHRTPFDAERNMELNVQYRSTSTLEYMEYSTSFALCNASKISSCWMKILLTVCSVLYVFSFASADIFSFSDCFQFQLKTYPIQ